MTLQVNSHILFPYNVPSCIKASHPGLHTAIHIPSLVGVFQGVKYICGFRGLEENHLLTEVGIAAV